MGNFRNVYEVRSRNEKNVVLGEAVTGVNQIIAIKQADGEAYVATDAAGLVVAGINKEVGLEGETIVAHGGEWVLENDTVSAVSADDIGKICYFKDSRTVTMSTGSHSLQVGMVLDVRSYGVKVDVGVNTAMTASA